VETTLALTSVELTQEVSGREVSSREVSSRLASDENGWLTTVAKSGQPVQPHRQATASRGQVGGGAG
jgi:hypothetical protein